MKTIHFVAGLPRSGSTMMMNILKQNPHVGAAPVSSLCTVINAVNINWESVEANREYPNDTAKIDTLTSILQGYHKSSKKDIIFDKDRLWVTKIGLIENIIQAKIKILCPVRNPAEIITSFERIRRNNPLRIIGGDSGISNVSTRALYYSAPDGVLGLSHAAHKDAVIEGYLDRLLFVDYNKFCNTPKSQLKRIYEFFELPKFEHNMESIVQNEQYNDHATGHPGLHKIKNRLERTTVNCVQFLGLELYEQYNREIFWDAWV
jgi:sulfotransferase